MPDSIARSAPPEKASLPEAKMAPLIAASDAICATIASSSSIAVASMTFIDRPGMSQVIRAMPWESVSILKVFIDSDALYDGRGSHAGADAQRHQRGLKI